MKKKDKPVLTDRQKKFLTVFRDLGCNISATCLAMNNMSRDTFYRWKEDNELFAHQVENITEGIFDYVESKLIKCIKDEKESSIHFYLRTRVRNRGYVERQEVAVEGEITFLDVAKKFSERNKVEPLDEQIDEG